MIRHYYRCSWVIARYNYHISRKLKTSIKRARRHESRVFIDSWVSQEGEFLLVSYNVYRILTTHVHANRWRQRNRPIVVRSIAGQHRVNVVPAQVLYNDLATCHIAVWHCGPICDESVVAIPRHDWGRFTYGNRSILLIKKILKWCWSDGRNLNEFDLYQQNGFLIPNQTYIK